MVKDLRCLVSTFGGTFQKLSTNFRGFGRNAPLDKVSPLAEVVIGNLREALVLKERRLDPLRILYNSLMSPLNTLCERFL